MGVEYHHPSMVIEEFNKLRLENEKLKTCLVKCSEEKDLENIHFELYKCLTEIKENKNG